MANHMDFTGKGSHRTIIQTSQTSAKGIPPHAFCPPPYPYAMPVAGMDKHDFRFLVLNHTIPCDVL